MNYKDDIFEPFKLYEVYGYQEKNNLTENQLKNPTTLWRKIGDVQAKQMNSSSNVGMACTLTQFSLTNKYHFSVRAKDIHNRLGPFSDPKSVG